MATVGSATLTSLLPPKSTSAVAAPNPLRGIFALSSFTLVTLAFAIFAVVTALSASSAVSIPNGATSRVYGSVPEPPPFKTRVPSVGPTTSLPTIPSTSVIPKIFSFTRTQLNPSHWMISPGTPFSASASLGRVTDPSAKSRLPTVPFCILSPLMAEGAILAPVIWFTSKL